MNIQFVSRDKATSLAMSQKINKNTFIISISDTEKEKMEMCNLFSAYKLDYRTFVFADLENSHSGFNNSIASNLYSAIDIAVRNKRDILVHCFVGVSRSGAVAKFINDFYLFDDWYLNDYEGHNKYIYNILMETAKLS